MTYYNNKIKNGEITIIKLELHSLFELEKIQQGNFMFSLLMRSSNKEWLGYVIDKKKLGKASIYISITEGKEKEAGLSTIQILKEKFNINAKIVKRMTNNILNPINF